MEHGEPTHAGGIVLGDSGTIALVHNTETGTWTFPKGGIEKDESLEGAARREIEEETGLTGLELIDDLGSYVRTKGGHAGAPEKIINLFLFAAPRGARIVPANEIGEALWVPLPHVAEKLTIAKDKAWFASVFERVRQAIQRD